MTAADNRNRRLIPYMSYYQPGSDYNNYLPEYLQMVNCETLSGAMTINLVRFTASTPRCLAAKKATSTIADSQHRLSLRRIVEIRTAACCSSRIHLQSSTRFVQDVHSSAASDAAELQQLQLSAAEQRVPAESSAQVESSDQTSHLICQEQLHTLPRYQQASR